MLLVDPADPGRHRLVYSTKDTKYYQDVEKGRGGYCEPAPAKQNYSSLLHE